MISDNKSPPNIESKDTNNNQKKEESKELIQNDNANIINNGHIIQQSSKEISSLEKNINISNPNKQNENKNYNINNNSSSSLNILENKLLLNSLNNINQKNNCQYTNSIINNTISIFNQSNQYNINNVDNNKNVNNNLESNPNNDDNAIYLIDSEDEKEINSSQNKTNDKNNGNSNDINNNISNNNSYKLDKMSLNSVDNNMEKKEYLKNKNNAITGEKKIQNSNNVPQLNTNTSNNVNNNITSNNENKNDEKSDNKKNSPTKQTEKKLYYRRKLNSYKRKYKGKEELNLQVFIANYGQKEIFPSFIFGSKQFFYYPRNYRHITPNGKGYIISFPGLKKLFNEKLIKKDLENMCTYYFKQKRGRQNSLDIKVKDEKTLNDGVFLNDGIVNFYLKIIEDEYTCGEGQTNNVLIQKSFFYNSLSNQQNPDLSNNFCYPDSCSFIRTKINVFSFKTLIIPICEHYHWSLIIVNDIDKMGNLFTEKNLKEYYSNNYNLNDDDQSEYPEFFYLDSLYNINYRRMIIILKYLFYEYQKIYSVKCDMADFFMKNFRKIECYNPEVPKQDNSYDCGIFLLIYAELFLYNPNYFLKIVSKKYKINNEINNKNISIDNSNTKSVTNNLIINNNNIINNINITNNANNTNIILKNIISPQSEIKNINYINIEVSHNIINNENINSNNIISNNINSLNINENPMKNNNFNNDSNKIKNIEISIKNDENKENIKNTNSNETINNIDSHINNELENALDKIDIEIDGNNNNNLTENNDNSDVKKSEENNEQNDNNSSSLNNDMKNAVNEASLRNWFSSELVNNQRNKIKNLINELSKIEKEITDKNDIDGIRKEQNSVIKKYMEMQKKEFDDYFSKLKD